MSTQPTYEDLVTQVNGMKVLLAEVKDELKDKKEATDDEDKKVEAAFKQAKRAMKDDEKEHKAAEDDKEKVKDAFKIAEDETDPEKKKDAMKKAMDEKDDYDKKHAKKAEDEPKTEKKDPERDAKIATLEDKYKEPIIQKILQATTIVDPANVDMRLKQLNAASLSTVEEEWNKIKPFVANIIPETASVTSQGMIPFQASITSDINEGDIFSASADTVDFSKMSTEKILEMYQ